MCSPQESFLITGSSIGSVSVYDLTENNNESTRIPSFEEEGHKYKFLEPTFTTDGFDNQVHNFSIQKIVSLYKKGSNRIVTMDESGVLGQWVVVRLKEGDAAGSIADLTLCINGKIKLVLNGTTNL